MRIFKKISGILLLALSALLSYGTVMGAIGAAADVRQSSGDPVKQDSAYTAGLIIGFALFGAIAFFLAKFGLRLLRTKAVPAESLDDIGKPQD